MIRASVYVDLSAEPESGSTLDRRKLSVLERCPTGAHVVVDFGQREFVSRDAAFWLHEQDSRLDIEIRAERPEAVARFVHAARAGDWQVGA
jgi:hypothetical protein